MKPHIWRLATVGLLCVSISGQVLAEEQRGDEGSQHARPGNGQQHGQPHG
ncbi:glycine zipper family protein, partial [Pseudomonas fragi]|nr:glycine zipper family protein [Pseudomonas sp. GC01]